MFSGRSSIQKQCKNRKPLVDGRMRSDLCNRTDPDNVELNDAACVAMLRNDDQTQRIFSRKPQLSNAHVIADVIADVTADVIGLQQQLDGCDVDSKRLGQFRIFVLARHEFKCTTLQSVVTDACSRSQVNNHCSVETLIDGVHKLTAFSSCHKINKKRQNKQ